MRWHILSRTSYSVDSQQGNSSAFVHSVVSEMKYPTERNYSYAFISWASCKERMKETSYADNYAGKFGST
jgi:hypothetical protein